MSSRDWEFGKSINFRRLHEFLWTLNNLMNSRTSFSQSDPKEVTSSQHKFARVVALISLFLSHSKIVVAVNINLPPCPWTSLHWRDCRKTIQGNRTGKLTGSGDGWLILGFQCRIEAIPHSRLNVIFLLCFFLRCKEYACDRGRCPRYAGFL